MARSRTEQMISRLKDLQMGTPDIEASAVVSVDGLMLNEILMKTIVEDFMPSVGIG